jgi:predicted metal-dependent phosphoesterase TrpH
VKYDLHVHTSYSKKCGYTNPKNAVKAAIKSGLDGIAITDHDTIKGAIQAKEYSLGFFDVIIGSEITTNRGEIIGLFLSEDIESNKFESVISEIKNQNGLAVVPHPFDALRKSAFHPGTEDVKMLDGIESFNSRCILKKYNDIAENFANKYNLMKTAGSDAHFLHEIGNAGIITENCDIIDAIRKRDLTVFGRKSFLLNHAFTKYLILMRKI